ncbi:hypothetical protein AAG747_26245 [Rapidithrix thailandica]|uniref:Uncharacterized protein n=1 Tax=Rapidithrix thailandica TaxID=413964 RepID=A0AAW9SFT4_9BACT
MAKDYFIEIDIEQKQISFQKNFMEEVLGEPANTPSRMSIDLFISNYLPPRQSKQARKFFEDALSTGALSDKNNAFPIHNKLEEEVSLALKSMMPLQIQKGMGGAIVGMVEVMEVKKTISQEARSQGREGLFAKMFSFFL